MFGIDDAIIAAIVSSLAGAALSAKDAQRAAARQRQASVEAQGRQLAAQNQATQVAAQKASEFDPTTRKAAQDALQQDLTQQYDQQVAVPQVTAQGVQVGTTIPQSQGSGDYALAKAKEAAKTQASLHALASLMGRIGSSSQLRQNEAVGIGDAAGQIGRIQTGANNIFQADQSGVAAAGQPDLVSQIAAAGLRAYGSSQLAQSGLKPAGVALPTTGTFSRMDRGQVNWA